MYAIDQHKGLGGICMVVVSMVLTLSVGFSMRMVF